MNQSSYLRRSLGVFLTLTMLINTPLSAEARPTKTSEITLSQLQDRSILALKQMDVCAAVIETAAQNVTNGGASNLDQKKKTQVRLQFQLLRKEMNLIKDAAAIHINEQQLVALTYLTNEVIRVLTAAINSGLEVVPELNIEILTKKSTEKPTLAQIDRILVHNEKRLKELTDLSEKIGLTQLNKMYRGARKMYRKYYVWPIVEHTLVYTAFIHWSVFVTPRWAVTNMKNATDDTITQWLGESFGSMQKWMGKPPSKAQQNHSQVQYLVDVDKNAISFKAAPELRIDNAQVRTKNTKGVLEKISMEDHINNLVDEVSIYQDENGELVKRSKDEIKIIKKELEEAISDNLLAIENAPKDVTIDKTKTISGAGGGSVNYWTDRFEGIVDMDWKSALIQIPIAKWFHSYLAKDYDVASNYLSKVTNRVDDLLFGITKKSTYESLSMPEESFDDIVGREEIKEELSKLIEYICSPDKFDRAGIKVERGYLFAGDPQNGKTFAAKALTREINEAMKATGRNDKMRLFEISTDSLIQKGIAHWMDLARYHAPCILFLDELDLLRLQRDGDSKLLSEFLTCMSGTLSKDEKSHVIILAATNKPENLDFALRQHGRFGKMFWFDKPTFNNRIAFFKKECEKRCMNTDRFDFNELAQQTEGCSFGSLDIVMKKTLMLAKFAGTSVTQQHFEKALDSEIKKMIPCGYDVPAEKEQIVAVHQAGKAIMNIILESQKQLSKVTVLPITQDLQEEHVTQQYNIAGLQSKDQRAIRHGGIFSYHWSDSLNLESQDELKKQCKILLAGNVAQTVFGLPSPSYDKVDKQEAFKIAKDIVFEGLDQKDVAKATREDKLTQAYRLVEQYEREIAVELTEQLTWLVNTTTALQDRKTLSIGELNELRSK
ncbi:MAG: ATP-dependent Zn protease [Alteromonas naphthalenivorans]|jgi:ATP-dependent Zn protease